MANYQSAFIQASGSYPAFLESEFCQFSTNYTGSCCLVKARRHGQWFFFEFMNQSELNMN